MTSGTPEDYYDTKQQLKHPNPIHGNKTWLRHRIDTQAAEIDLMLLDGNYSIEKMAHRLNKIEGKTISISHRRNRIENHIKHLQSGESRGQAHGMNPHNLKIECVNGKWQFVLD